MKGIFITALTCSLLLCSCDPSGVKKRQEKDAPPVDQRRELTSKEKEELKKISLEPIKVLESEALEGGIKITYFIKGNGPLLKDKDVVQINYEVLLDDGTMVDGNKLLNRETLPFMLGFGMQTPGWEIAFKKLHVGDFVEIYLPSKYARGEKGIKGVIPPNANNRIRVKVVELVKPTRTVDGTKVWVLEESSIEKKLANEESEVEFHYMVSSQSKPKYDISYKRNQPYLLRFSDFGIVKGLKKALINAKKSDKLWILIPPAEAYGDKGLMDLVKPGEYLFYDIFIMDVR